MYIFLSILKQVTNAVTVADNECFVTGGHYSPILRKLLDAKI